MRSRMQQLLFKFARWMQGRNGPDDLCRFVFWAGMILWAIAFVFMLPLLDLVSLACLGYAIFRMTSRRIDRRQAENAAFLRRFEPIRRDLRQRKLRFDERKEFCFFRCSCGAVLRVRRGQGKKELICPKCHAHMTRNTR